MRLPIWEEIALIIIAILTIGLIGMAIFGPYLLRETCFVNGVRFHGNISIHIKDWTNYTDNFKCQ